MKLPFLAAGLVHFLTGAVAADDVQFQAVTKSAQPAGGMETLAAAVVYPETARRDGLEGLVRLQVAVDAAGQVGTISVLQAVRADLDSAAVRAVRAVSWEAARSAERPLPCLVVVPIDFRLGETSKP